MKVTQNKAFVFFVFVTMVLLFLVRNLPWQLDDYDQAKQAYAALDVVERGHLVWQHLPFGGFATKPPLLAWLQAGIYSVIQNWDWAWRLPGLAASLTLAVLIYKLLRPQGTWPAVAALAAFGFNMLTIRIACLVRTDMLLALLVFIPGMLIFRHVQHQEPWTLRQKCTMTIVLCLGLLTKGHVVYAFLFPSVVIYWGLCRLRNWFNRAWFGWLAWIVPMTVFVVLIIGACWFHPAFYQEIIVDEVMLLFQHGEASDPQHPLYYVVHLLHKWMPWSLLLLMSCVVGRVVLRKAWKINPAWCWLVCWNLGAMIMMSVIPNKRVDRIYPVIPSLSVFLGYTIGILQQHRVFLFHKNWSQLIPGWTLGAMLLWSGYTCAEVIHSYRLPTNALAAFCARIRHVYPAFNQTMIITDYNEGFQCYLQQTERINPADAATAIAREKPGLMIIQSDAVADDIAERITPYSVVDQVTSPFERKIYRLYAAPGQ